MKISEIGGEFALINRIARQDLKDKQIIKGIGDDCAVLAFNGDRYWLATTDMMVENDHFSRQWFSPLQIGEKLMEVNVSDIVSMGGFPRYALLSMCLPSSVTVEFMDEFYKGIYQSAERHGIYLVGGDTTHGENYVFNLTLLGEVEKNLLRLRSMARPGDLICVTGTLGGSTAGLKLLQKGLKGYIADHVQPRSRTAAEAKSIAGLAHAMIDVSDGLASEVKHICEQSKTGACINYEAIPLSDHTLESAKILALDAHEFALYGGEDFELVFTIAKQNIKELQKHFSDFSVVGEIVDSRQGVYLVKQGHKLDLPGGYDHFRE